jgi:hypothetical protein
MQFEEFKKIEFLLRYIAPPPYSLSSKYNINFIIIYEIK